VFAKLPSGKNDFNFDFQKSFNVFVVLRVEFVRTGVKNVLRNEIFPVRIPDDRSSLHTIVVICLLKRKVTKCPSNAMYLYFNRIS